MAKFEPAFLNTMKWEDDPHEPGRVSKEPNSYSLCQNCETKIEGLTHPNACPHCSAIDWKEVPAFARFGINSVAHPDMGEDFWTEPAEDAKPKAEEVYESDYWRSINCDAIDSQPVANKLFDMGVNMGTHQAVIYLQRSINFLIQQGAQALINSPATEDDLRPAVPIFPVKEDGNLGPKTEQSLNALDSSAVVQQLRNWSATHYNHLAAVNPAKYGHILKDWLKRAAA